ncbi:uncharacterized protein K489DRAFT_377917 [Dissoconium aciculare CBS 342.82]|uniref:Sugar phosphate transporter domain-containing protein n=1 Tax=Dissoconium aciculare CBS 342.82 TaxID=1314786 RepID=A0A6J3MBV7_9PEZI|nr:uncharacterized protein K489DRAFT_377917 [Dissoconium aciculare CBS 342.82]KAF1825368.1 hypothetical protein K489DRAFT_377917 [Dissoconium aciculare CBS 342.82]
MDRKEYLTMVGFSLLFTLNIAMSNISLDAVSVAFHQTVRSASPAVTILLYRLIDLCGGAISRRFTWTTCLTTFPLILGIALATKGDFTATSMGLSLTLAGVILASMKQIAMGMLMTGPLQLSSIELLLHLSPLAMV